MTTKSAKTTKTVDDSTVGTGATDGEAAGSATKAARDGKKAKPGATLCPSRLPRPMSGMLLMTLQADGSI